MDSSAEPLFRLLFKYPARVFEQGTFVWQNAGLARWIVPIVAGLGLVAAASYFRFRQERLIDRIFLSLVRLTAIVILGACLLRPGLLISTSVSERNVLGIVLDDSKSMLIRDGGDSVSRLDRLKSLFGDSAGASLVSRLSKGYALRFYRVAQGLERIERVDQLTGIGGRTDLSGGLGSVRRDFVGAPLAGVILVTDGADNGGLPIGDEILGFQANKVPVYTVGIGSERFNRDLSIERLEIPRSTLRGSVLLASVVVRSRGMAGQAVSLTVEDGGRIVATEDVTLLKGDAPLTVPIRIPPLESGVRQIRVSVRPVPGEAISQNNHRTVPIRVREGREKILYLEGRIRPEMAFMRRAAAVDSNLQLVVLQRTAEGKFLRVGVDDSLELIRGFPKTRAELFQYRALILGSVEASFFTADQLRMIADFVGERGGGLLALGGRDAFGEGSFEGTSLAEVLPVSFTNRALDSSEAPTELAVRPTEAGLTQAALLLGPTPGASRLKWDSLPPLTTVNRLTGIKPGATILLAGRPTSGGPPLPVLVSQRYGRGRVASLGVQDTWLWQMAATIADDDQSYETFWRQLLRWLLEEVPERIEVTASPLNPLPGQRVTLRAEVVDSTFVKVSGASVLAQVTGPDGATTSVPLDWALGEAGVYTGDFVPKDEGDYQLDLAVAVGRDTVHVGPERIGVADQGVDFLDAELRTPLLERIAKETGGKYYTEKTVNRLPDDVQYTKSGVTVQETKDLWDIPIVFFALVFLMGLEWLYRRYRGLV